MHLPIRTLALALTLACVSATPAAARDCYRDANAAFAAGRYDEAGALFARTADDPACTAAKARLLINAGAAYRRHAERSAEPQWYCKAADAYQRAAAVADSKRLVEAATTGAEATVVHCPAASAAAVTPSAVTAAPDPRPSTPRPSTPPESAPPPALMPPPETDADDFPVAWVIGGVVGATAIGVTLALLLSAEPEAVTQQKLTVGEIE